MLIIEHFVTSSPEQLGIVIEGMRNPLNSWDLSDSEIEWVVNPETQSQAAYQFHLGDNDAKLMSKLSDGGPVNAKYRRMMPVWAQVTAPLYWWKEFDTYKVGTTENSCSTMHKIHAKEFTIDDFSHEHLDNTSREDCIKSTTLLINIIDLLNYWRHKFLEYDQNLKTLDLSQEEREYFTRERKHAWWQMIQLLPSSYNQTRLIYLGYETLNNIDIWRYNHKLDEWHTFCDWIETLPYYNTIMDRRDK